MIIHSTAMREGSQTRKRIERAALELFVEQGVSATSIRQIAQRARVSQGAMYNHYVSKEELALALFQGGWSDIGGELRLRSQTAGTLLEKFEAMIDYVFDRFDRDWPLVSYVFFSRHGFLRQLSPRSPNPYLVFRKVIVDAMHRGEIPRQEGDLAASMVIGAIIQVIDTKILGRLESKLRGRAAAVARGCVGLLTG